MSDAATKTCSKCGEIKESGLFPKARLRCRDCLNERLRQYRARNPEQVKESRKKSNTKNFISNAACEKRWRSRNSEKVSALQRKWRSENKEKRRKALEKWKSENQERFKRLQSNWAKKSASELSDKYVADLIVKSTKMPLVLISQELIEVKRNHLQLVRKIKELTNER